MSICVYTDCLTKAQDIIVSAVKSLEKIQSEMTIVVENIPIVADKAKIPKFIEVLRKIFSYCGGGSNGKIAHVDVPTNPETGATLGYAFIEFTHIEGVKDAVKYGHGFVWANMVIKVKAFTDISKSMEVRGSQRQAHSPA
jgi:RNA recognition motif-containing protein